MSALEDEPKTIRPGSRSAGYRSRTAVLFAIAEVVGKLASFVMFAVATRLLGPEGFGQFSWAMGLGMMMASIGMFGFDMALIQLGGAAPHRVSHYLTSTIALRLAIGVVAIAALAAWPMQDGASRAVLLLMATALSLDNISMAVRSAAAVVDRQRGAAMNIIVQRVAIAAIAISVLFAGGGVVGMAAAFLAGNVLGTASMLILAHRIGAGPRPRNLTWADTKALAVKSVLPGAANTMNMQTTRVDVLALARGGSYASVGYFSSAYKLMETSLFLSESLIRAAMPAMLYARIPGDLGRILRALFATAAIFYFPLATCMVVRGQDLLDLLFGNDYGAGGHTAMVALAWAMLVLVVLSATTTALLVTGRSADVAAISAVTMVVKLIIVWPLVDRWGPLGAGLAVAIAFSLQCALLWWRLAMHGGRPRMGTSLVAPLAASAAMVPALISGLTLIPALAVAGVIFIAVWFMVARWADPQAITRVSSVVGR